MAKRLLRLVAVTVAVVYAVICLAVYLFQAKLVYFPERQIEATPKQIRLEYEPVTLQTEDGIKLSAWFVPAQPARGAVLFCHGNAVNISHLLDSIEIFHRLRLSTLVFDYRGYGQSEGAPSEEGTYRDAEAAWRYLVEQRGIAPNQIVISGRSLGGSVAAWLGNRHPSAALIIESSFTSIADIGAATYRYLPVRLLSRFEYNTAESLRKVRSPVLIIHSRKDELIPYSHGMELFRSAHDPKAFLEITGDHNSGFLTSGALYEEGIQKFLDKYLP